MQDAFASAGITLNSRLLMDYHSGRTDRIVWELEVDNLTSVDATFAKAWETPEQQAAFSEWFQRLCDLIHYAEVENWRIA